MCGRFTARIRETTVVMTVRNYPWYLEFCEIVLACLTGLRGRKNCLVNAPSAGGFSLTTDYHAFCLRFNLPHLPVRPQIT